MMGRVEQQVLRTYVLLSTNIHLESFMELKSPEFSMKLPHEGGGSQEYKVGFNELDLSYTLDTPDSN